MGHLRLGRLPRTVTWRRVTELLASSPEDTPAVAAATIVAGDERLRRLANDDALNYSFWLLTRIALASRQPNFLQELGRLGLNIGGDTSTLGFIAQTADHIRERNARFGLPSNVAELAALSLRRALAETAGVQAGGLFGTSVSDLQASLRQYSTDRQFGVLAQRFFGDYFARTLRFVIDRELPNQVARGGPLTGLGDSVAFTEALDAYARQSARIMRDFAVGWYGKADWRSKGQISQEDTQRFVAVALRKLRSELKLSGSAA